MTTYAPFFLQNSKNEKKVGKLGNRLLPGDCQNKYDWKRSEKNE